MARLEEEQVKFRSTSDLFPPATGKFNRFGLPEKGLIQQLNEALAPQPQNIQTQRTFGPGFSGTPQGTPTTGGFGDRARPDLVSSRGETLPTQAGVPQQISEAGRVIPITEAGQAQPVTLPRFGAEAFSPGVTEITDVERPAGGSRVFTNLLQPGIVPSQERAAEIVSGVAPLPGQLGTARPFATRAPLAGATQLTGEGQIALNRLSNLPEGGVAPTTGRQANGFGAARVLPTAPAAPTTGFGRRLEAPVPEGPATAGASTRTGETGFDLRPVVERGDRRLTGVAGEAFTALGEARGAERAPEGETRREKLVRERGVFEERGTIGGQRAAGILSSQIAALDKEERAKDIGDRAERQLQLNAARLDLDIATAAAKVQKDLDAGTKGDKFKFVIGETDLLTGQPKAPSVTIGEKTFGLDPIVATTLDRTAKANFAEFRAANPQDDTSPEELLEFFLKQAFLDNVGAQQPTQEGI